MLWRVFLTLVLTQFFIINCRSQGGTVITLDPLVTYQTMTGWEAHIDWESGPAFDTSWSIYQNELLDRAVNELGLNRVQVSIFCGLENPRDYFTEFVNGQIDRQTFRANRYKIVNDNNNPNVINPSGFHFSELDYKMGHSVLPLKQRLEANGEKLYISLTYVDFESSPFEHADNPAEYAELVLAIFQHMDTNYGFVPDAVEVKLEPDNRGGWNDGGIKQGRALAAAGDRLKNNGFTPHFIISSCIGTSRSISYFDNAIQEPGALQYVTALCYHRYGWSLSDIQTIASRGQQYGIDTSMLEWWSGQNSFKRLHEDLKVGNVSAWQGGVLNNPAGGFVGPTQNYIIKSNLQVTISNYAKYIRQYYKFVRRGATRIEATSSNGNFDPVAFINTDGKYVVVVKAAAGGDFSIQGLPTATYGIKYTTGDGRQNPVEYDVDLPDMFISTGQSVTTSIPASGVITVYAKSSPPVPVELSSFSAEAQGRNVLLTWVTQSETNNFGFEVQRSQNGNTFLDIGFIQGNRTSTVPNDYRFVDKNLHEGKYYYRLKQIDLDGGFEFSGTVEAVIETPRDFVLSQNHPNPFNALTTIGYNLPKKSQVKLVILNLLGHEIATLVNTQQPAGSYRVQWDTREVASGIYLYKLQAGEFTQTRKMLLIK